MLESIQKPTDEGRQETGDSLATGKSIFFTWNTPKIIATSIQIGLFGSTFWPKDGSKPERMRRYRRATVSMKRGVKHRLSFGGQAAQGNSSKKA